MRAWSPAAGPRSDSSPGATGEGGRGAPGARALHQEAAPGAQDEAAPPGAPTGPEEAEGHGPDPQEAMPFWEGTGERQGRKSQQSPPRTHM